MLAKQLCYLRPNVVLFCWSLWQGQCWFWLLSCFEMFWLSTYHFALAIVTLQSKFCLHVNVISENRRFFFFFYHNKFSLVVVVNSLQNTYDGSWLLEDAAPHYCCHHHSASVPLCCLLLVSLTAVSQASAYWERPHRLSMLTVQLANVMFTISICWSPVTVITCSICFTLLFDLNDPLGRRSGCKHCVYRCKWHQ